jgi:hypothetical protein
VLQYSDAQRQIPFTADWKRQVLQVADEIRRKRGCGGWDLIWRVVMSGEVVVVRSPRLPA